MSLTVLMRAALEAAQREPLRRVHDNTPGAPAWPAHPCTLHALERHELVIRAERLGRRQPDGTTNRIEEWTITTHGSLALNPPPRVVQEQPVFLARPTRNSGDYTRNPGRAIDRVEVLTPDASWGRAGETARVGAQDKAATSRKHRRHLKAA